MLDLLGAGALAELPPADDDWYLNLLWVDGKKCLLLTHSGTLFSIFLTGIRKADLKPLGPYLTAAIKAELCSELLPADILGPLDTATVHVAKTASRSTLSFMNDMTYHLRYQVDAAGGLDHCDVPAINHRLQRTLHNRDGYVQPLDLVVERLLATDPESSRQPASPVDSPPTV